MVAQACGEYFNMVTFWETCRAEHPDADDPCCWGHDAFYKRYQVRKLAIGYIISIGSHQAAV
jgi:hypothetical protein